jgi:hypothetical protein
MAGIILRDLLNLGVSQPMPNYYPPPTYSPYPAQIPPAESHIATLAIADREAVLMVNGFVRDPKYDYKCDSPCKTYVNSTYSLFVILSDNGTANFGMPLSDQSLIEGQTTLLKTLLDQFYGSDVFSWVSDNLILAANNGQQDGVVDDLLIRIQVENAMFIIIIMSLP